MYSKYFINIHFGLLSQVFLWPCFSDLVSIDDSRCLGRDLWEMADKEATGEVGLTPWTTVVTAGEEVLAYPWDLPSLTPHSDAQWLEKIRQQSMKFHLWGMEWEWRGCDSMGVVQVSVEINIRRVIDLDAESESSTMSTHLSLGWVLPETVM
jgi:hypothetical protein